MKSDVPKMRFRLQRKEAVARPNVLGNHSFPVHTYRWVDIAMCDDRKTLEQMIPYGNQIHRVIDTEKGAVNGEN